MHKKAYGFTIVELLIVIVVIAILAAISIVAYTGIQGRARDAQRLQDMSTIVKALEAYKVLNGNYPDRMATDGADGFETSTDGTSPTDFLSALKSTPIGISNVPVDPANRVSSVGSGSSWLAPYRSGGHYVYFYARYNPGINGCDSSRGHFYVLGIARMDTISSGSSHPQSPGFSCPGRDWAGRGAWVTGGYVD